MKKRNILAGIVVVVVVLVAAAVIDAYGTTHVDITAVYLDVSYTSSQPGYFGPTRQSIGGSFTVTGSSEFTQSFEIKNNGTSGGHAITGLFVQEEGFLIDSVSPNLPYTLAQGSSVTIKVTIRAPSYYSGALDIVLASS